MGCTDNDTIIPFLVSRAQSAGSCVCTCSGSLKSGSRGLCKVMTIADIRKVCSTPILCNIGMNKDMAKEMTCLRLQSVHIDFLKISERALDLK